MAGAIAGYSEEDCQALLKQAYRALRTRSPRYRQPVDPPLRLADVLTLHLSIVGPELDKRCQRLDELRSAAGLPPYWTEDQPRVLQRVCRQDRMAEEWNGLVEYVTHLAKSAALFAELSELLPELMARYQKQKRRIITQSRLVEKLAETQTKLRKLEERDARQRRRRSAGREPLPLTARQAEVVQAVADSKGNYSRAARELGLDRTTVKEAHDAAMEKLKLGNICGIQRLLKQSQAKPMAPGKLDMGRRAHTGEGRRQEDRRKHQDSLDE